MMNGNLNMNNERPVVIGSTTSMGDSSPDNNNNNNNNSFHDEDDPQDLRSTPGELLLQPIASLDDDDIVLDFKDDENEQLEDFLCSVFDSLSSGSASASFTQSSPPNYGQQHEQRNDRPLSAPPKMQTCSDAPSTVHSTVDAIPQDVGDGRDDDMNPAVSSSTQRWNEWDVPMGRSMEVREFVGNVRYRSLVLQYRNTYLETDRKAEKTNIALTIYNTITAHGGRFLDKRKLPGTKGPSTEWYEIPKERALAKIGQAMRLGPRPLRHEQRLLPPRHPQEGQPTAPAVAAAAAAGVSNTNVAIKAEDERLLERIFDNVTISHAGDNNSKHQAGAETTSLNSLACLLFAGEEGNSSEEPIMMQQQEQQLQEPIKFGFHQGAITLPEQLKDFQKEGHRDHASSDSHSSSSSSSSSSSFR
mmetsp:Transcript_776/g.1564  ORF Transcript_776/g.1564 Transcript_776/m.1564 type:complete len:416 (-) Transcript_776:27-1274(-)